MRGPGMMEMMKGADSDSDGQVSREEYMASMNSRFERLDGNKDGKIGPEEFGREMRPGQGPGPFQGGGPTPMAPAPEARSAQRDPAAGFSDHLEISQAIMRQLDANGDGRIQRDEAPPRVLEAFGRLDGNGDGALGPEDAGMLKRYAGGRRGAGDKPGAKPGDRLMQFDANRDGKIQKGEARGALLERFDKLDRNGDGVLEQSEMSRKGKPETPKNPLRSAVKPPKAGKKPAAAPATAAPSPPQE